MPILFKSFFPSFFSCGTSAGGLLVTQLARVKFAAALNGAISHSRTSTRRVAGRTMAVVTKRSRDAVPLMPDADKFAGLNASLPVTHEPLARLFPRGVSITPRQSGVFAPRLLQRT